ncbi:MAG: DUF2911 domain-containing protein [Planctomycetes bacterium]|nr:DUF2911 domain-containing protein [Planctomycetota bacterium]MBI3847190.1 DUF2911 domain-containing protein [Planctomycetota bacterium]
MQKSSLAYAVCGGLLLLGAVSALNAAPPQKGEPIQVFDGDAERVCTRLFYFNGTGSPGQFSIDYGQPEWKAEYDSQFDTTKGKRLRFGKDFWTTLDTNLTISISGKDVTPGHYYLALDRSNDDKWSLVLLDPKTIQGTKTDAFQTAQTTGGTLIPLTYEATTTSVEKLTVKLQKGDLDPKKSKLVITWGKHKLSAPIVAQIQTS